MDLFSLLAKLTLDKTEYDKGLEDAEKDANKLSVPPVQIPKPDNTEFKSGLDEAEETGNLWKEVMVGVWNGVKDAIVVTGITSAVMAVVGAMRQGIDSAIETGDAVKKGAANLGISTKAYQEYEYALGKSGLKAKDLSKAMEGLGKIYSGDLTEKQKKYVEELKEMGFAADEAAGNEKNLSDMMKALADYQGNDKGQIINWLFGSNQNWDGYFRQTSAEVEKLTQAAEDMGLIMPDDAIDRVAEFKSATDEINERIEAMKRSFGEGVLPVLTDIAKTITTIMVFFSGGGEKSLAEMFAGDDKELADQLTTIEGTGAAAQTLADKLLEMGDTSKMTADQYAIWKGTAEELIKLVPSLGEVIDTETGKITANSDEIKENIRQWQELSKTKAIQAMKEQKFQEITQKNSKVIEANIEANRKAGEAAEARVESIGKINDVLKKYGIKEGLLGENATREDINAARQKLSGLALDENGLASVLAEFSAAESGWSSAIMAEQQAIDEAAKLQKQVDDGMKDYEEWCASLEQLYGTAGAEAVTATGDVNTLGSAIKDLPDSKTIHLNVVTDGIQGYPKAIGGTIPYDNFPALLHRGEKVLTATQVRRGEGGGNADLSGLKSEIISAIKDGMNGVTVNSYLNGKDITAEVNRNNMREVKGRRFAT